jgi:uncharacterized protein (DUF2336 family)
MIAFQIIRGNAASMDLGSPVLDVAPCVRGDLLQALARHQQPVTLRQLASAAGVSPWGDDTIRGHETAATR